MTLPIIYPSALEFWKNTHLQEKYNIDIFALPRVNLPEDYTTQVNPVLAKHLFDTLDVSYPIHLSCNRMKDRRNSKRYIVKFKSSAYPDNSFVAPFSSKKVFVASPELCYLQAARVLQLSDLVRLGINLCSGYYLDDEEKIIVRDPLISYDKLSDYICSASKSAGVTLAKRGLEFFGGSSLSPMETNLQLFLSLPEEYGGCGIKTFVLNKTIVLSSAASKLMNVDTLRGDLVSETAKLVIEYNSKAFHSNGDAITNDINRQIAINSSGYDYIGVTPAHIFNSEKMEILVNIIRKKMGLPAININKDYFAELFDTYRKDSEQLTSSEPSEHRQQIISDYKL